MVIPSPRFIHGGTVNVEIKMALLRPATFTTTLTTSSHFYLYSLIFLKQSTNSFSTATIRYRRYTHSYSFRIHSPSVVFNNGGGTKDATTSNGPRDTSRHQKQTRGSCTLCPLLSILLANVQSLENKLEDLRARVNFQRDILTCNILCFTKIWLNPAMTDHAIQPS